MRHHVVVLLGVSLLLCLPLACGGGGGGGGGGATAPRADYGDAPDGGSTGYPEGFAQVGSFPTLFASNGARTLNWSQAFLGVSASGEWDATDPADPDGAPNLVNADLDDGLADFVILLTAIPPPTTMTLLVGAPGTSAGGTYYVNAVVDLDMDGSWGDVAAGGESEWVVRNEVVTVVPGSAVPVTPPPFAFSNGNVLPEGAWMRVALTPDPIVAGNWDGTGSFPSGEIEDHRIWLPEISNGQGGHKSCYLRVDCNGPYPAVTGTVVRCRVTNFGRDDCSFNWTVHRQAGAGMNVAPVLGAAVVPARGAAVVLLTGTRVGDDLPSTWWFQATPDPGSVIVPGGVVAGMGESASPFELTTCFDDPASQAMLQTAQALECEEEPLCGSETAKALLFIIHSMEGVPSKDVAHDHTTITRIAPTHESKDAAWGDAKFNHSDFPCGSGPNGYTLCPSPTMAVPGGDFLVVYTTVEADVPLADTMNLYQYAFVFDADGDTTNNYVPAPQFPNDFFKGTDRWYEALYDPATGWSMKVTDARDGNLTPAPSAARIILKGNALVLVVPKSEFGVDDPAYRVTAFRHSGDYGINPPYDYDGSVWPAVADGLESYPPEWP